MRTSAGFYASEKTISSSTQEERWCSQIGLTRAHVCYFATCVMPGPQLNAVLRMCLWLFPSANRARSPKSGNGMRLQPVVRQIRCYPLMRKLASVNLCQNLFRVAVVRGGMCSGVEVPYQHSFTASFGWAQDRLLAECPVWCLQVIDLYRIFKSRKSRA